MNIIDRLNAFLEISEITKSQFADNCEIPRPTASQILSGRNKKISDDIIGKIHSVYPDLSISWLMFGEGEMLISATPGIEGVKLSENSKITNHSTFPSNDLKENELKPALFEDNTMINKNITKIVVFYSDNSFEEFYQK